MDGCVVGATETSLAVLLIQRLYEESILPAEGASERGPAGVPDLPVSASLIVLILAEKLLPGGHAVACATGLGLVGLGTVLLFP